MNIELSTVGGLESRTESPIVLTFENNIAVIRFNRPRERNPLSVAVLDELHQLLDAINSNSKIRRIIFTGTDDVFPLRARICARLRQSKPSETAREYGLRGQNLMRKIADSEKPTIAAINGFCFGGLIRFGVGLPQKNCRAERAVLSSRREFGNYDGLGRNAAFTAFDRRSKSIGNFSDREKSFGG